MLGTETSVVPFTLGSPMYGGQEATLVIFFFDETYQQKAMDFISSLKSKIVSVEDVILQPFWAKCNSLHNYYFFY